MTKEDTLKTVKVMQAFANGETVQVRRRFDSKSGWTDEPNPVWDFFGREYRIKPKSSIVKFGTVQQFVRGLVNHSSTEGAFLLKERANGGREYEITDIDFEDPGSCIHLISNHNDSPSCWHSLKDLACFFTFEDGTPCGTITENND